VPGKRGSHQHTAKADRMAEHIEESAKEEGRYKGRERSVAWATVHKEMPKSEAHRSSSRSGRGGTRRKS
jgi:hypothetical protein